MLSVFIKEQKRYYKNELVKKLRLKPEEVVSFIRKLKSFGVLKMVKATPEEKELSELINEEIELINEEENTDKYFYVFTFVGILTVGNRVFKCYPKYIEEKEPQGKMKQVLHVLKRYNSREQIVALFNGEDENTSFNLLAVMIYLLEEYAENGVYSNEQVVIENNGMGEILWENTINETFAVIKDSIPIYIELKTLNVDEDEQDFFRRLHYCIVTKCSKILEEAGLANLFDLNLIDVSEAEISDFGDDDYILYRIQRELDIQFNDRKKMLLKTMYTYISHRKAFETGFGISMFGTNSFNLVWEKVCSEVFENKLSLKVCDLPRAFKVDYLDAATSTMIELIEKPKWRYKNAEKVIEQAKTLRPDLISIYPYEDNYCFSILDAKYYLIRLTERSVEGQPGVGDVTKQYLYQLAYEDLVEQSGYKYIQNAFLVPGDNEQGEFLGRAEFEMMRITGKEPLEHISVIRLPAQKMYAAYLSGRANDELLEALKLAPIRELHNNSFSYRMMAYLKTGKLIVRKDEIEYEKIISYPEKIRGDVGAKVMFDIIAPEVARHSYVYSPYRKNQQLIVAESGNDVDVEVEIVEFIMKIIKQYLDYTKKGFMGYEDTLKWTSCFIKENGLEELFKKTENIAEILWILYRD